MHYWTLVLTRDVTCCFTMEILCGSVWLLGDMKYRYLWRTLHTRATWGIAQNTSFTLFRKPSQIRHAVMSKIAWLCSHNYHSMLTTVRNACLNPGLICIDLSMTTWCLLLNSVTHTHTQTHTHTHIHTHMHTHTHTDTHTHTHTHRHTDTHTHTHTHTRAHTQTHTNTHMVLDSGLDCELDCGLFVGLDWTELK